MTARDEVLELLAARMRDLDLPIPTKRAQMLLVAYDAERRAEVAEEFATALLAVDPVEWALAGQYAGHDAAALIRRVACISEPDMPCAVCTHPRAEHGDGQLKATCRVEQCFCRMWHKDAASIARLLNAKEPK